MNTENAPIDIKNNPHADIIQDLQNDFKKTETANETTVPAPTVEVIPSFLPLPLVKLCVAGKNGLIVHYLSKNLPESSKSLLKDHYKPTDEELNLYTRFLEGLIWTHFRQVADWFINNKGSTVIGEVLLFESVRAAPIVTMVANAKNEEKKEEKKSEGAV